MLNTVSVLTPCIFLARLSFFNPLVLFAAFRFVATSSLLSLMCLRSRVAKARTPRYAQGLSLTHGGISSSTRSQCVENRGSALPYCVAPKDQELISIGWSRVLMDCTFLARLSFFDRLEPEARFAACRFVAMIRSYVGFTGPRA